jgi:hypothetical protein
MGCLPGDVESIKILGHALEGDLNLVDRGGWCPDSTPVDGLPDGAFLTFKNGLDPAIE